MPHWASWPVEENQMKLTVLYVVVVGAILVWWLRSVKPTQRI